MKRPDWFTLIERWVPEGMGQIGPTLPFVVGALAFKAGQTRVDASDVRRVLDQACSKPVKGFVTCVVWCSYIGVPVFSMQPTNSPFRMKSVAAVAHPSGQGQALIFGSNLMTMWECTDPSALLKRLVEDATEHVTSGSYSRHQKPGTVQYEYGRFSPKDIAYIQKVIMSEG